MENFSTYERHLDCSEVVLSMSRSDAGHFFQTSDSLATSERRAAKAKNKYGHPIKLPSKLLAAVASHERRDEVIVAEAAGAVKCVNVEVCKDKFPCLLKAWLFHR